MKITARLSHLLMGAMLLPLAPSVLATQYTAMIRNCEVNNIGPNLWQAKFYLNIYSSPSAGETTDNRVYVYGIRANSKGLPSYSSGNPVLPGWTQAGITLTNPSSMKVAVWNDRLDIQSTSITTPNVIYGSGWVTVNVSTANNGAYPGLYIFHREYHTQGLVDQHSWALPNKTGSCYTGANIETNPPDTIDPIDKLEPPEPEFKLNSAVWELNTVDVEDLPDVAAVGNGYQATIKNIASNNFCVSYATAGVKDKAYALSVTNGASLQGGRNLFMMQNGSSQLPYNLQLSSNDGVTGNNFDFPTATAKYINLSQAASSVDKRSEMCWTPKINLFKNASTSEGMHSETLNFIITPKA